ncbi:DUF998 domain-containing protein [Flavobacterium sp. LM4]|uniref:DUF998 domain-containing protein n=1 Tax=Flavobacterium sp. LM4 TaxID=1938609 RepID=UPI000992CE59|nr:DUF998 domain-containing protein [Flavobacterium sp. LM4]OOV17601.1 hypothetical protein BXU10_16120 [Flavobacterium sp. LM4]
MRVARVNLVKSTALICITVCISDVIVLLLSGCYYPGYRQLERTMSSLGASESPVSEFISAWWIFIGIVFIFFGIIFRKAFGGNHKNVRLASLLLILYGLGEGIGSGVFKADRIAGKMTDSFVMHDIAGGIGVIAALILPLIMKEVIIEGNKPGFTLLSRIIFTIGFITMLLFTIHFSSDENNFIVFYKGLWQRLFMLNLYVYFIVISAIMYHKNI